MATLENLNKFSGEEDEDAFRWYKSFLGAVGPLGERGMLNHFPLYMEPASPAQIWCDGLPKELFSNWIDVDRSFRRKWLDCTEGGTEAMEQFQNHHLTDDAIFSLDDVGSMNEVIADWAENHARLGDEALMEATLPNLPVFIRAFLKYNSSPPKTFQSLCARIKEITDPILEFEKLRRQEKNAAWKTKLEKKRSDEDPKVVESDEVNTISFLPEIGPQNVVIALTKAGMAEIVKEAMRALRRYQPSDIAIDAACSYDIGLLHFCNTVKATAQFQPNTVTGQAGTRSALWEALFKVNHQKALNGLGDMSEVSKTTWKIFSEPAHIIKGECVYSSHHTQFISPSYNGTSPYPLSAGNSPYYGGLAQIGNGSSFPYIGINSFSTVLHFLLSAYAAQHVTTDNSPYVRAATDSANWIKKWAYDENTRLAKTFTWDMTYTQVWGAASVSPHVTGLFIEGLCVLASVTGEQKWMDLACDICVAATVYPEWHDHIGIFKYVSAAGPSAVDDANTFRGLLIRGLCVAYQRNPANEKLRSTIRNYINTQFNGLRDSVNNGGLYPVAWNAPSSGLLAHGQIAALDALMAAVIVNYY